MARDGPLVLISDPFRNTGNLLRSNSREIYSSILLTWLVETRIKCIIAFCYISYFGGQLTGYEGSPEKKINIKICPSHCINGKHPRNKEVGELSSFLVIFSPFPVLHTLRLKTPQKNSSLSTIAGDTNQFLSSFSLLRVGSLEILIHYSLQLPHK